MMVAAVVTDRWCDAMVVLVHTFSVSILPRTVHAFRETRFVRCSSMSELLTSVGSNRFWYIRFGVVG